MGARPRLLVLVLTASVAALGCGDLRPEDAAGALVTSRHQGAEVKQPVPKDIPKRVAIKNGRTEPAPDQPAPGEPAQGEPRAEDGALAGTTAAHNAIRAGVGVPPLAWDPAIAGYAQAWADHLATANNCQLAHRPAQTQLYGENLYWSTDPSTNGAAAVAVWAAEAAEYNASTGACSGVCGHYTQVVWSSTTRIGCGFTTCPSATILVCNYAARGNYVGQKPY
ncbi:MAG: CAP domain-containing protein [Nannocystaceae bacterium]